MGVIAYRNYKPLLFDRILNFDTSGLEKLVNELSQQGHTKKEIYLLFEVFHRDVQTDSSTKDKEEYYDVLTDFMDGFTSWAKGARLLPDEPDV
ncbi:MAG: hypothetical protein AAFX87_04805 [Bacteroidota bacterium]